MGDQVFTTDAKAQDTRPEVPRLIYEGVASISTFSAVTGGYLGSVSIDLTKLNDIGNTNKAFSSSGTYKIEVFHSYPDTSEFDVFRPLPYQTYYNPASGVYDFTGQVRRWAWWQLVNQHVLVDNIFNSTLSINYFASTNAGTYKDDAGQTQYFIYKIWSVPMSRS